MSDEPEPQISCTEYLVKALEEAGDPRLEEILKRARRDYYHDFKGVPELPEVQLVMELRGAGHPELAERVINGEFDAQPWEAEEWASSQDGRETFQELIRGLQKVQPMGPTHGLPPKHKPGKHHRHH